MSKLEFSQILKEIKFSEEEIERTKKKVEEFRKKLIKMVNNAEIFIGGSYAKETMLRKSKIDIDIFVIFPSIEKNPSEKLKNVLKKNKIKFTILHGSRDYFQVKWEGITFELVPIIKIKKANEAKNITDISPLHVDYILKKIKKKKSISNEIILAKSFCYSQGCYGAESYIQGFSGYSLEVLITYYGSFLNFIKNVSKWDIKKKTIIDPEKYYKNEKTILEEINKSKQFGPLILIDPVQKERNVCAALGKETLNNFIINAKKFLKKPSKKFFFKKEIDIARLKKLAIENKTKLISLKVTTIRNKMDIIGAKLKKFYNFLIYKLNKEGFKIIKSEMVFDEEKNEGIFYFIINYDKNELIINGPPLKIGSKHIEAFKNKWPNSFIFKGRLIVKTKRKFVSFEESIKNINKKQLRDMGIKSFKTL